MSYFTERFIFFLGIGVLASMINLFSMMIIDSFYMPKSQSQNILAIDIMVTAVISLACLIFLVFEWFDVNRGLRGMLTGKWSNNSSPAKQGFCLGYVGVNVACGALIIMNNS